MKNRDKDTAIKSWAVSNIGEHYQPNKLNIVAESLTQDTD